jgi:putative restriction endonuclease
MEGNGRCASGKNGRASFIGNRRYSSSGWELIDSFVRELMVASHIVPWSAFPNERLNPQNGLCLSRLHDGAFDAGLITFDDERRLVMSKRLKKFLPHITVQQHFETFVGKSFALPDDAPEPHADFIRYHRENLFN